MSEKSQALLLDDETVKQLAKAVVSLDPEARILRWVSLSLCIADAVWSIGARYDDVVVPLVRKLAASFGVDTPTVPASEALEDDPLPLTVLATLDIDTLVGKTNRQRTSSRRGILKADAVLRHATAFLEFGISTLPEAVALLGDIDQLEPLEAAIRKIPGEGGAGIRRGYLWMLIGDDDVIKPDRMVLRWFRHHGVDLTANQARRVIVDLSAAIETTTEKRMTPWMIDHALWRAGRSLPRI